MITVRNIKYLGIILAIAIIVWGIAPFFSGNPITNDDIATAIVLILIGIAYPLVVFKPEWIKALLFFEGLIFAVAGYMLLAIPYNYGFALIGLVILIISILAYLQKLPMRLLRLFYR